MYMTFRDLSERIGKILATEGMTLSVAESCTGGLVAGAITSVAGSSRYFAGGVIAYNDRIKRDVLRVPRLTLSRYGAVSAQTAKEMALGVQRFFKTDCAIAVSGIAGPGGGTKEKPIGLVYIAAAVRKKIRTSVFRFKGGRGHVRAKAVEESLKLLIRLSD
jgi:PncC family amidohydrolase